MESVILPYNQIIATEILHDITLKCLCHITFWDLTIDLKKKMKI